MRVVFDTNIFISALIFPGGPAQQALYPIIEGKDHLFISKPLIHELLEGLARKFGRDREELSRMAVCEADLGARTFLHAHQWLAQLVCAQLPS